jgi:hypothetical protein
MANTSDFLELKRIAPLSEVARLTGLSVDTIRRNHRDRIIKLSPRRVGMRIEDALMLSQPRSTTSPDAYLKPSKKGAQ